MHHVDMIPLSHAISYVWLGWGAIVLSVQSLGAFGMYVTLVSWS